MYGALKYFLIGYRVKEKSEKIRLRGPKKLKQKEGRKEKLLKKNFDYC